MAQRKRASKGRPKLEGAISEGKSRNITFSCGEKLRARLERDAKRRSMALGELIRQACEEFLRK